jgi:hypothetical protein
MSARSWVAGGERASAAVVTAVPLVGLVGLYVRSDAVQSAIEG